MRQKRKRIRNTRSVNNNSEIKKLITIIVIVIVVCILFYLIALLLDNKNNKKEETQIQFSEIIVGTMLEQEGDYYVLAYIPEDKNVDEYKQLMTNLSVKNYTLDLTSVFNSKYLTSEENFDIEKINDIKFSETTLLNIKNGKIVNSYVGEEISNTLNMLMENA